jgi:hypothetical protein
MFLAFIGPSSGVCQATVYMLPFGSCGVCRSFVCVCKLVCGGGFTVPVLYCTVKPPPQTSSQVHTDDLVHAVFVDRLCALANWFVEVALLYWYRGGFPMLC